MGDKSFDELFEEIYGSPSGVERVPKLPIKQETKKAPVVENQKASIPEFSYLEDMKRLEDEGRALTKAIPDMTVDELNSALKRQRFLEDELESVFEKSLRSIRRQLGEVEDRRAKNSYDEVLQKEAAAAIPIRYDALPAFIVSFVVTMAVLYGVLGWWLLFALILSGLSSFYVSLAFEFRADRKEKAERENYIQKRKTELKNRAANERRELEASLPSETEIRNAHSAANAQISGAQRRILNRPEFSGKLLPSWEQTIAKYLKPEISITLDETDPDTQGRPVVSWYHPKIVDEGFASDPLALFNRKFLLRPTDDRVAIEVALYFNQGVKTRTNFTENSQLLYRDDIAGDQREYKHFEAPENTTLNYYLVAEVSFAKLTTAAHELDTDRQTASVLLYHEQVRVRPYKSKETQIEEEIAAFQSDKKREALNKKLGVRSTGASTVRWEEFANAAIDQLAAKREFEAGALKLEEKLREAGCPDEDIEEIVDNYIKQNSPD